jgi:hypothetical protein
MSSLLRLAGDAAVWTALTSSVAFCLLYATLAPWWRSAEGWHLMTFTAVIAAAFGWLAYRQTTAHRAPSPVAIETARACLLAALAALLVWRLVMLIHTQTQRKDRPMSPPEDFESPPAGEPIPEPPPGGATDAGLDGVDVTDEYLADDGAKLTAALGGTWAQVLAYARSYLGKYPPGRVKENVNAFTKEYYGNNTAAAWCLIFVWHCLKHFGLATWKLAYVPWLYKIAKFHSGRSGIKPGDICAIAGYSHVGFFVTDHGSTFDLLSGNSTSGNSSDAITVKRYNKSVISGYARPTYGSAPAPKPTDDDDVVVMVIAA